MRVFTSVELPAPVRERLAQGTEAAFGGCPEVRLVPAENLHVTVRFLGEVGEPRLPELLEALGSAAGAVPAGAAALRGFGAFPEPERARILWCGVEPREGVLTALEARVSEALLPFGLVPEERAFTAHVTVGRVRGEPGRRARRGRPRRVPELARRLRAAAQDPQEFGSFPVRELALVESRLGPRGPSYTVLRRLPLATAI